MERQVSSGTRTKAIFSQALAPRPRTLAELATRNRSQSVSDALITVEWLNATEGKAAHARVLEIRKDLQDLETMLSRIVQRRRQLKTAPTELTDQAQEKFFAEVSESAELQEQFRKRHNALNQALSRYTHVPALAYSFESGAWRFNTLPRQLRGPQIEIAHEGITVRVNESSVVAALARLATNHELHKVRLCEQCEKRWRISERAMDRFCSQKCRQAFYETRPEFKERRARNQKNYQRNQKVERARPNKN